MPSVGIQTSLSCCDHDEFYWVWVEEEQDATAWSKDDLTVVAVDENSIIDSLAQPEQQQPDTQVVDWSDKALWPMFPRQYFLDLGNAHCRWGGTKSQKYAVRAINPCDYGFARTAYF